MGNVRLCKVFFEGYKNSKLKYILSTIDILAPIIIWVVCQ